MAIHNCQHLNRCIKYTFLDPPSPSKSVHINIFQMENLHENDKKWVKMLKVYGINIFSLTPLKECFVHLA